MAHGLTGIHHIQLAMPVGEEEAGRRFYGDLLGLPEVPKPSELAPRGGIWFRSGELEVHLGVERADFRPATKPHPAFVVTGLDELRGRLEEAGYRIDEDVQLEGYRRFHVRTRSATVSSSSSRRDRARVSAPRPERGPPGAGPPRRRR